MATLQYPSKKDVSSNNLSANTYYYEPVIASGETTSDNIQLGGHSVIGVVTPTMTGASLTVEVSLDGLSWYTLSGVSITVAADTAFEFASTSMYGWQFIRFVSASSEGADRTLHVLIKEL